MPDLPAIFDAIRKHDPTIIPSWAEDRTKSQSKCFFDYRAERPIRPECMEVMLVGWLFYHHATSIERGDSPNWGWDSPEGGWYSERGRVPTYFPPSPRGCILALCHAIGIEVADG